jgi:hypothetical protein
VKAKEAGREKKMAAVVNSYKEGHPAFLWTESAFYLTKVAGVVGARVAKPYRRLFASFEAQIKLPELDKKLRRDIVNEAKKVLAGMPGVSDKAVAKGLAKAFNMPVDHVFEHKVIRQAHRELEEAPAALAAVEKHIELKGEIVSDFKVLAGKIIRGPAKAAVSEKALMAACYQAKAKLQPLIEAAADAIVKEYLDGGGTFDGHAKVLGPMVMEAMKPEGFDLFAIQGAAFRLIPAYKAKFEAEEDAGVDAILAGRMGHTSGGKSGATLGDAFAARAVEKAEYEDRRKGGKHGHNKGRGGKPWKK